MKSLYLYFGYGAFAFLLIKAYLHLQYDRQRRKTGSLFLRWFFGAYAFSIMFPILSAPNSDKQQKLKKVANTALILFYVFFILTLVAVYIVYGS
jgi:amino acid permease